MSAGGKESKISSRERDREQSDTPPSKAAKLEPTTSSADILADRETGTYFFTVINKRRCFVLPTTKNYADFIQLRYVKTDSGANRSLFYFEDVHQMMYVLQNCTNHEYIYSLQHFNTVGRPALVLQIQKRKRANFSIRLMTDILPPKATHNDLILDTHCAFIFATKMFST